MDSFEGDDDDNGEYIPLEVMEAAKILTLDLLPKKSRQLYTKRYNDFKDWCRKKGIKNSFAEEIFLLYFDELSKKYCSSTLWAYFSMLKACIEVYDNLNIGTYHKLVSFIKQKHKGYKAKKAKTFTTLEVAKFCYEAPDDKYLVIKVSLHFLLFFSIYFLFLFFS